MLVYEMLRPQGSAAAILLLVALQTGCGGDDNPVQHAPPTITQPPASTAVFKGQTAVLEVQASGDDLTYAWSRDGQVISGASGIRYETPPLSDDDDDTAYRVAVRDRWGAEVISEAATVRVLPPVDLRFKWVGSPVPVVFEPTLDLLDYERLTATDRVGGPLRIGDGHCAPAPPAGRCWWALAWGSRVRGVTSIFESRRILNLANAWWAEGATDWVVTSLDAEDGSDLFAAAAIQSTQSGSFSPHLGFAPIEELAAIAASEGARGRVVTAVSFTADRVAYMSYGWSEAPGSRFDTRVINTPLDGVEAAAAELASAGYVITAFGAGLLGTRGAILIGTRAEGEPAPRALRTVRESIAAFYTTDPGWAFVGFLVLREPWLNILILQQ